MKNSQEAATYGSGRQAMLLGLGILLVSALALVTWAQELSRNLLHMSYLRGLAGDETALLQAGEWATTAAGDHSSPIFCQIDLALNKTEQARQTCAGASTDMLRQIVHTVEVLGQTQGSERTLQSLHTLSLLYPDSALLYYRMSQHQPAGHAAAVDSLRRALELSEQSPELTIWELVEIHLQLAQNYMWWEAYELALQETSAALNLIRNERAYRLQALAYANLGQFEQANASIQAAAVEASYWLYLDRGDVNRLQGNVEAADADYTAFLAQSGEADRIHGYLKLCSLYVAAQSSAAIEPCQKLVEHDAADASYRILLGDAFAATGEYDAAKLQYRHALTIDPQNEDATQHLHSVESLR